jgi:hypothetical protein
VPDLLKITERERRIVLTSPVDTLPTQRDDVALEVGTCRPKRHGERKGEAATSSLLPGGTDRTSDLRSEAPVAAAFDSAGRSTVLAERYSQRLLASYRQNSFGRSPSGPRS